MQRDLLPCEGTPLAQIAKVREQDANHRDAGDQQDVVVQPFELQDGPLHAVRDLVVALLVVVCARLHAGVRVLGLALAAAAAIAAAVAAAVSAAVDVLRSGERVEHVKVLHEVLRL